MEYTLTGGTVIDGTGSPGYRGDLSIKDGIITAIASDLPRNGTVIEIQDQVVCPGFIDMHSHTQLFWLADPGLEAKTRQGITTEVTGPDGYSAAPIRPADVTTWRTHLSGIEGDPPTAGTGQASPNIGSCFEAPAAIGRPRLATAICGSG